MGATKAIPSNRVMFIRSRKWSVGMKKPIPTSFARRARGTSGTRRGRGERLATLVWRRFFRGGTASGCGFAQLYVAAGDRSFDGHRVRHVRGVFGFRWVREKIQDVLFSNFLPASAAAMRDYFSQFVENAARLTAFASSAWR
jgi:hypothetical protein